MKKALPLLVALIVVAAAAIVLIVTVLNKPDGAAGPSPGETPGAPAGTTTPVETGAPSPSDEPSPGEAPEEEGPVEYVVDVGGTRYSLTVDNEVFDVAETPSGRRFTLKADNDVFIETMYIPDKTAFAAAPAFLYQYIDYLELESSGKDYIPGTEIIGETVTGYRGDKACSAWLVDIEGGVVAVAVSYSGNIPQAVLDALATLKIEQ